MQCSRCEKTAWYQVNGEGFCEDHREDAYRAVGALKRTSVETTPSFHLGKRKRDKITGKWVTIQEGNQL